MEPSPTAGGREGAQRGQVQLLLHSEQGQPSTGTRGHHSSNTVNLIGRFSPSSLSEAA